MRYMKNAFKALWKGQENFHISILTFLIKVIDQHVVFIVNGFRSNIVYRLKSLLDDQKAGPYDKTPIICILMLLFVGITAIYSSHSHSGGSQWIAQLVWAFAGGCLYYIVSRIDYEFFAQYAHVFYNISIVLLLMLWTPFGERRFGALRWVNLGVFAVQPSEPAKLGFLFMLSAMMARTEISSLGGSIKNLAKCCLVFCIPTILIFLQPDLGSALTFPVMFFAMLYISKLSKKFFLGIVAIFLIAVSIIAIDIYGYRNFLDDKFFRNDGEQTKYEDRSILPLKDYQRDRILAFLFPDDVDPNGIGVSWNLRQSLIAVGTGGLTGKGFNNGTQAQLGYLPKSVASNDFIFSVIAEERGLIGSLCVILLYVLLIGNGLRTAQLSRDRFGTYICIGTSILLLLHIVVNIGMTLGLMPITGIPLPFLSYGGSFLLICCFLQGMTQSVYRYHKCFV